MLDAENKLDLYISHIEIRYEQDRYIQFHHPSARCVRPTVRQGKLCLFQTTSCRNPSLCPHRRAVVQQRQVFNGPFSAVKPIIGRANLSCNRQSHCHQDRLGLHYMLAKDNSNLQPTDSARDAPQTSQ